MVQHADSMDANAIIVCMRYDANAMMEGISEVLCNGTAVKISKVEGALT